MKKLLLLLMMVSLSAEAAFYVTNIQYVAPQTEAYTGGVICVLVDKNARPSVYFNCKNIPGFPVFKEEIEDANTTLVVYDERNKVLATYARVVPVTTPEITLRNYKPMNKTDKYFFNKITKGE